MAGLFITFEGPEGSGKTTQIKILAQYLQEQGYEVLLTREPGGTAIGQKIREVLLMPENEGMTEKTELFLYAADRSEHVEKVIKPALATEKIVLCDRFIHSTMAYQGYGRGLDRELITWLNQQATDNLQPDLVMLLDVPPVIGLTRALRRREGDRIELEEEEFHLRVRTGFLKLAAENTEKIKVIDSTLPKQQVSFLIKKIVNNLLGGKYFANNSTS